MAGDVADLLTGDERDAYEALKALFHDYGLDSLAPTIFGYVQQGYGADVITTLLQQTPEYKARFAGNEIRRKAGLAVLSPAEYLSAESAYRQILNAAGLPKGFYDSPSDFTQWIAADVSPTEIKSRVDMAVAASSQANDAYKMALQQMYGIGEGEVTAYFLDRKRAEPLLQKQAAAASIGAAAIQRGFSVSPYAEQFAAEGITAAQAQQGYAQLAESFEPLQAIARRFGANWSLREAERDVFEPGKTNQTGGTGNDLPFTTESVTEKRKRLASQERALFSGRQGSSAGGLSGGYRQT